MLGCWLDAGLLAVGCLAVGCILLQLCTYVQLTKLKDRMKVIMSQVQQVEKKIEGVKINKSKVPQVLFAVSMIGANMFTDEEGLGSCGGEDVPAI